MRYSVRLKPSADRALSKLARDVQARILDKLEQLAANPFPAGVEKMQEEPGYRVRVGDYRIVYDVLHHELIVFVIRIGHRREIYR